MCSAEVNQLCRKEITNAQHYHTVHLSEMVRFLAISRLRLHFQVHEFLCGGRTVGGVVSGFVVCVFYVKGL